MGFGMADTAIKLPLGNILIRNSQDLGRVVRAMRRQQALTQLDLAGLGKTGNRFVVELENGKPTVQLQKVLDVLALLGLEVIVRRKGAP